jgi:hypothetical protein
MFKDQVRWLRLRAGCSKRGFGSQYENSAPKATARTLPVNKDWIRLTQVGQDPGVAVEAT